MYQYYLEISFAYGAARELTRVTEILAVVNRSNSEFGPGWWVAGYERAIPQPNGDVFWIGGDGSTRRYSYLGVASNGNKIYKAPMFASTQAVDMK